MNNRLSKSALAMAIALAMLAGKPVFSEAGEKIGKVQDLIIAPEHALSYVIVGAGGFIGIGRHDVAVPVAQIEERTNRLVMSGATRESISAMPTFGYAGDTGQRDRFVAGQSATLPMARPGLLRLAAFEASVNEATARMRKAV